MNYESVFALLVNAWKARILLDLHRIEVGCTNILLIFREAIVSWKISRKHFMAQFVCFSYSH